MSNQELTPRISQGLVWRFVDEDAVLVNPCSGAVRVLNGVGTFIWKLLEKQTCVGEIESFLVSHYGITVEEARVDLSRFLGDLAERDLISWEA